MAAAGVTVNNSKLHSLACTLHAITMQHEFSLELNNIKAVSAVAEHLWHTWPPRSQSLMVTEPFATLRMLKPTVGIMSSW